MRIAGWSDFILVNETQLHAYRLPIRDDVVFGRSTTKADITLEHSSVARRHGRLHVKGDHVEIIDHGATTGIYVNGSFIQRAALNVGDTLNIGHLQCRLEPIGWLGDGPPQTGTLSQADAYQRMVAAFVHARQPALSEAERDDIWWSLYADWWRTNGDERLFEDAWRLWTPNALRLIRRGLDDQPRWFLARGYSAFDALVSHVGLGELLGFDLLMTTQNATQRDHAERRLESRAAVTRRSMVQFMLGRLDAAWPEAPRFLAHILRRAMQDRAPFPLGRLREVAQARNLAPVLASLVLITFDRPAQITFRLEAGELLTMTGEALVDDAERVRVARPEDLDIAAWGEELASHEIVQPFPQL